MKLKLPHLFIVLFLWTIKVHSQNPQSYQYQNGDLIFLEGCSGSMNSAIKDATYGIEEYNFTHVGILWEKKPNSWYIIEATHPKVKITNLQEYLYPTDKCPPKAVAARLKIAYQPLIPKALKKALKKVGKKYDDAFDINNDQYYCSEFIYYIFKEANNGQEVFPLKPMTFKSREDGQFPTYWIEHFKKLKLPIPEGKLGNNPGDMSRSKLIDILYYFP